MNEFFDDCRGLGISIKTRGIEEYLRDESRFQGHALGLARMREEREILDILTLANKWNVPITVVSGKTSLTGAPVPLGGIVLDLKGLDAIDPDDPAVVQPGVILKLYKNHVQSRELFYPPDPTSEDSCTLGGNVACDASGALSYLYGPTRNYIQGLRVALPTGSVLDINRGDVISCEGLFRIPARVNEPTRERDLLVPVPKTVAPPWNICKNAAGLFSAEPMDLVDLFIGSEGILGIILEIRTRLLPRRSDFFALMLYLPSRELTVPDSDGPGQHKALFPRRRDAPERRDPEDSH